MNKKSSIIDYAKEIGIDCIGFTDTRFHKNFIENLKVNREKGLLSGFEECDEKKRVDINSLLSEGKTLISVGIPYKYISQNYTKPYVSKYTMGTDYHRIVLEKINLIADYIKNNFNEESIVFCDTGALHDKEIARKSGIGFQGKNTNIITKKYGSYIFLGEVLTTLKIEPDNETNSLCGDCTKCIDACPAKAIDENGVNGKKCLSYITQKKEDLTIGEINSLGNRVFGCDTCQDVCPYNKSVEGSDIKEFLPFEYLVNIDIEELLNMTNKEFKLKYGKNALSWRGKFIIQRNAIIAAGNSKNKNYIDLLKNKRDNIKLKRYIDIALEKLEEI